MPTSQEVLDLLSPRDDEVAILTHEGDSNGARSLRNQLCTHGHVAREMTTGRTNRASGTVVSGWCQHRGVDFNWDALASKLVASLSGLRAGRFLVVEYMADQPCEPLPYAQGAPEPDGWYCEVVSDEFLSPLDWPLDEVALRRVGWEVPDAETRNWWLETSTAADAARRLIDGLRYGRGCSDPQRFIWSVGTFPTGPNGGEPIPAPERAPAQAAA